MTKAARGRREISFRRQNSATKSAFTPADRPRRCVGRTGQLPEPVVGGGEGAVVDELVTVLLEVSTEPCAWARVGSKKTAVIKVASRNHLVCLMIASRFVTPDCARFYPKGKLLIRALCLIRNQNCAR
jgi:hypothetical protein